jgi:hypothetical protein
LKKLLVIVFLIESAFVFAQDNQAKHKFDSIQQRANSFEKQEHDNDALKNKRNKADTIRNGLNSKYDSVKRKVTKPTEKVSDQIQKVNAAQAKLTQKIDSIKASANPNTLLVKSLDSLRSGLDSLKQKGVLRKVNGTSAKARKAQQKVNDKMSAIEGKANQKIGEFSSRGANIGSLNVPSVPGLAGVNNPMGKMNLNTDLKLPEINANTNLGIDSRAVGQEMKGANELTKIPQEKLGELKNIDAVKDVQGKVGDVSKIANEANGYAGDVKSIAQGKIGEVEQVPDMMENKLANLDDAKGLQKEIGTGNEYLKMASSDPEVAKELALNKAKDVAIDHFVGHEQELKAALDKMSKVKSKSKYAEGVLDMFKKPANPMKGKPFIERLVPGVTLQLQKSSNIWIDVNPYLTYRISGRFAAAAGWNERLSTNFKKRYFVPNEHIFGPRAFVEFKLKEGIILKVETEWMNTYITSVFPAYQVETNVRSWVWSTFAGVKNVFNFSKHVKGNVQVLYNLYNPEKISPYTNRLNVRFGFEFPLKKKPKKIADSL